MIDGIVVIDKPSGMTSFDVVRRVKRILNLKKVGHAGTLDPLATGVLVMLLGKSTKLFDEFVAFDKEYSSTLKLGVKTTTADIEGEVVSESEYMHITSRHIADVFTQFVGEIEQVPPMYSAIKIDGNKLCDLARQGIIVDRKARPVNIKRIEILDISLPYVQFVLECSKGTYVRQLAEDVGDRLGCYACISQIQRTKVGPFNIEQAINLDELNANHIRSW